MYVSLIVSMSSVLTAYNVYSVNYDRMAGREGKHPPSGYPDRYKPAEVSAHNFEVLWLIQ